MVTPLFSPDDPIFKTMIQNWNGSPPITVFAKKLGYSPEEILYLKQNGRLPPKKLSMAELVLQHMQNPTESKKAFLDRHGISAPTYDRLAHRNRNNGNYVKPRVDLTKIPKELLNFIDEIEQEFPDLTKDAVEKYARIKYLETDRQFKEFTVTDRAASCGLSRQRYYEIRAKLFPNPSQNPNAISPRQVSFHTLPPMLRDPEWWKEHGDATLPKQFSEWVDATITIAHNEKVPPILKEKYGSDEDLMYALGILYKGVAMIAVLQAIREDNWDKLEAFKQMKPTEDFDLDEWLNKL